MADSLSFELQTDVDFHSVAYILLIRATPQSVHVEAEQKDDGQRWCSEFSSRCAFKRWFGVDGVWVRGPGVLMACEWSVSLLWSVFVYQT